ncbi:hypothetical protein B0I35DRAFT_429397 [Stachybotrys elegans]|uniref:Uncharacterized protein n=1 Tax=Stachybotrys elegans TaxID=80388 RepID=A0A8K0SSG0_9HYPO|nr:hypothetical protein B0I35DRAFT_429397 [Stachybotrys elegans]
MAGNYVWYGRNESCVADDNTGRYCNDIIDGFGESESLNDSVYNTVLWYQSALEAIKKHYSVTIPSAVPSSGRGTKVRGVLHCYLCPRRLHRVRLIHHSRRLCYLYSQCLT